MFYKIIGDRKVFSDCRTIQLEDGTFIVCPTSEQIADAGWCLFIPPDVVPSPRVEPSMSETINSIKAMLSSEVESMSDEEALSIAALYPAWVNKIDTFVEAGERLWYDGKLYKVIQPHTVQNDWTPDSVSSLFVEIQIVEWPEWVQPTGVQDAYMTDDKVSHNNKHWVSIADANVWEPGIYGWEEMP